MASARARRLAQRLSAITDARDAEKVPPLLVFVTLEDGSTALLDEVLTLEGKFSGDAAKNFLEKEGYPCDEIQTTH
ncbi:MAG: hypothetical protein U0R19_37600 [Bryobacteraceae bacterium]